MTKKERNKILIKVLENITPNSNPLSIIYNTTNGYQLDFDEIINYLAYFIDDVVTSDEFKTIVCLAMVVDKKSLPF